MYNYLDDDDDTVLYLKLFVWLYADYAIVSAENEVQLPLTMNGMKDNCDMWNLQINVSKIKALVFWRGKIRNKPEIYFGDQILDVVYRYTYLGITFNYNGTFNLAIKKLYDIATTCRAMFEILKKKR